MKLLAISDAYLPAPVMAEGLRSLEGFGIEIEVRRWEHSTLIELQEANLLIERHGPDAVPVGPEHLDRLEQVEIVVVQFAPVSETFLERAPRLRLIGVLRGGTENVAIAAATCRGIAVANTPGRNARAVAECTVGLILAEVRNLARAHASLIQGHWRREFPNSAAIPELNGKTVGLIGFGAVGRIVAQLLVGFGCRILVYDPYLPEVSPPCESVSLTELLAQSDIVSLHARLTPETHHLLGREELRRMKPSAILVNTARSALVDESALIDALRERWIMGAALDVFDTEPLPPDHPFLSLDNVTLTPHLAGSTIGAFRNSPRLFAEQLENFILGRGKLPIVNGVEPALSRQVWKASSR